MLENAGWIAYGITRLTAIHSFIGCIVMLALCYVVVCGIVALFSASYSTGSESWDFFFSKFKPTMKYLVPLLILQVLVPTKDDGIVIVGTQVGANAIIQSGVALNDIKESELTGKLLSLAEAKIDNAIKSETAKEAEKVATK